MKKITSIIVICMLATSLTTAQEEMVAGWTFTDNSLAADTGISTNLAQEIMTMGGTSALELKNGYTTKAAQTSGWNDGMDAKAWVITLSTGGYVNLTLSSRQQSGGNDPGPKFFKIQHSIDGGTVWEDIPGGEIMVENDWETSFVDQLGLPSACNDRDELKVRWLMTSNEASGAGGVVLEDGKSKIDEVFIRGELLNAIGQNRGQGFSILPGASGRSIRIKAREVMDQVIIATVDGKVIRHVKAGTNELELDVSEIRAGGLIIVTIVAENGAIAMRQKYFLL